MKDIEFYIGDLDSAINSKDNSDINSVVEKSFQIKGSLELSMQLYFASSLLEVYYAQNQDPSYIQYVESDISSYLGKCEKRILSAFSALKTNVANYKLKPWEHFDKSRLESRVGEVVEIFHNSEDSVMRKSLHSALSMPVQKSEYYVTYSGDVYFKTAA